MRAAVYIDLRTEREVLTFIRELKSAKLAHQATVFDYNVTPTANHHIEDRPDLCLGGWYRNYRNVYHFGPDIKSMMEALRVGRKLILANSPAHFVSIARRMDSSGVLLR